MCLLLFHKLAIKIKNMIDDKIWLLERSLSEFHGPEQIF